jgi:hypothetical protein
MPGVAVLTYSLANGEIRKRGWQRPWTARYAWAARNVSFLRSAVGSSTLKGRSATPIKLRDSKNAVPTGRYGRDGDAVW